ncbi:MAG: S1 RNA-binding domain-containing protein, partial [Actinomycetota bacterium]
IPSVDDFPYALRLVSDVLESNGSTSMASTCASTLSLMDAGVPIKEPVAGIAMGLIAEGGEFVTLTDILGAEDALGDMDFKVAGTREFITALQLDTKVTGLPAEVLAGALKQAREARLFILDKMLEAISEPRTDMSATAPRIIMKQVPVDKIGEVIGPKGKMINAIIAETGASVDVEDDGRIFVGGTEGESVAKALEMIEEIVNPRIPEVGEEFEGTVVKILDFGAFVNLTPAKDGLLHVSKLGRGKRLESAADAAISVGDKIRVVVREIDRQGRISLDPMWDDEDGEPVDSDEGSETSGQVADTPRPERSSSGDRDRGGRDGEREGRPRRRRMTGRRDDRQDG